MLKASVSLFASGCFLVLAAASPYIGIVKSIGEFRVDGSPVRGNGTLFEGAVIETSAARSMVELPGVQVTLLPDSRARIYRDHTVLEKGASLLTAAPGHSLEASTLHIAPTARNSSLQVEIGSPTSISVAARSGGAEVRNSSGILLASLRSGMALAFDPQAAGASTNTKLTGKVEFRDAKFFLTDACTNVNVELLGTDLEKSVGKDVDITGSAIPGATPTAGASQVIQVLDIRNVTRKVTCSPAPLTAAHHGLSGAAKVAIIGGVAVAGAVVGLAGAGVFSGTTPSASTP